MTSNEALSKMPFNVRRHIARTLSGMPAVALSLASAVFVQPSLANDSAEQAAAADTPDGAQREWLTEIVVTATRREKNLQEVPISINVFSGDRLERSGVTGIQELQFVAAGLDVSNQTGETKVALRGIGGNAQFNVGAEGGVALHRDGVYLARRQDQSMSFFDVERIEVLRGPQGTLYGRNSTGGAVNIITKAPTRTFEAGGALTVGNYGLAEFEGYASGPVAGDNLTGRMAVKGKRSDGYTRNIFDGKRYDDDDSKAVRGRLQYTPTDSVTLDLTADYARDKGIPVLVYARGRDGDPLTGETLGSVLPPGRAINNNDPFVNDKEAWGLSARLEWDLGSMTLASLSAYREYDYLRKFDADGSNVSILVNEREERAGEQFSQEVTLTSSGPNKFEWVAGLFYFHSEETSFTDFRLVPINLAALQVIPKLDTDAFALFGEGTYAFTDRLTLTLGARYSYEEKSIEEISQNLTLTGENLSLRSDALEDDWSSFTPKAALTYTFNDDVRGYVTVGRGFKAGGFNGGQLQGRGYDPEKVTNYELGLKASTFDGRLRTNLSAFYMDYTDLQAESLTTDPNTGTTIFLVQNAATAEIKGAELEFDARITQNFSLEGNVTYLDATFEDFPNAVDASRGNAVVNVSGNQLANAPEWAANAAATISVPLGAWGSASLRTEYSYRSRNHFTFFEDNLRSQEPVGLLGARLTFESMDGVWRVALWARNITDELVANQRQLSGNALSGRPLFSADQPPRTYGVTFGFRF